MRSQTAPASSDPDDRRFGAALAAITTAFGDRTRREIYLFVRANPSTSASEVAKEFSLHPNVARHHLDRLAAGGYLQVTVGCQAVRAAGRPSKHYNAVAPPGSDPTLGLLGRRDDLLVALLAEALSLLGPERAECMAEEVGEAYGRTLAQRMEPGEGQRSIRAAMHAVADALTAQGFAARAEDRGKGVAVVADHCPVGEAAAQQPVICAVDRGMVRGLLATLCGDMQQEGIPVVLSSRARGDDHCAALV